MPDKRVSFKEHVRAAKEWLGEAESSLDKEQDLRGDLNLMLAQAELQRAQETQRLTDGQRRVRRLIPLLCALLLVGAVWQVVTMMLPTPAPTPAQTEKPMVQQPIVPPVPPVPLPPDSAYAAPEISAEKPKVPEVSEKEQLSEAENPVSAAEPKAAVPSRDMQKLMNTAGQSLRAE